MASVRDGRDSYHSRPPAAVRRCRHDWAVPSALKLSGFLAFFATGVLLAWTLSAGSLAAGTTTDDTVAAVTTTEVTDESTAAAEATTAAPETTTAPAETATAPGTTVFSTTTVATTTTRFVPLPVTGITTSASSDDDGTESWVWVLLAILAVALVALCVLLARRGRGGVSAEERRLQLDAAVGS
jgi:cobalamin biosynthesis Mg chelatase CobN